jgi:hypothetical protein
MPIDLHYKNSADVSALLRALQSYTLELRHNFIKALDGEKESYGWTIEDGFIAASGKRIIAQVVEDAKMIKGYFVSVLEDWLRDSGVEGADGGKRGRRRGASG